MDGIVDFPATESSPVGKDNLVCGSALLGATGLWIKKSRPEGRSHKSNQLEDVIHFCGSGVPPRLRQARSRPGDPSHNKPQQRLQERFAEGGERLLE